MKTNKPQNTFLALGVCLLIALGLGACQETPKPIKTSSISPVFIYTRTKESASPLRTDELKRRWLSGIPCRPPCWEGIIPGETSATKAGETLSANPMFTKVEMAKSPLSFDNGGSVDYEWDMLLD